MCERERDCERDTHLCSGQTVHNWPHVPLSGDTDANADYCDGVGGGYVAVAGNDFADGGGCAAAADDDDGWDVGDGGGA